MHFIAYRGQRFKYATGTDNFLTNLPPVASVVEEIMDVFSRVGRVKKKKSKLLLMNQRWWGWMSSTMFQSAIWSDFPSFRNRTRQIRIDTYSRGCGHLVLPSRKLYFLWNVISETWNVPRFFFSTEIRKGEIIYFIFCTVTRNSFISLQSQIEILSVLKDVEGSGFETSRVGIYK